MKVAGGLLEELETQIGDVDEQFRGFLIVSEDVEDRVSAAGAKAVKELLKRQKQKSDEFLKKVRSLLQKLNKSPAAEDTSVKEVVTRFEQYIRRMGLLERLSKNLAGDSRACSLPQMTADFEEASSGDFVFQFSSMYVRRFLQALCDKFLMTHDYKSLATAVSHAELDNPRYKAFQGEALVLNVVASLESVAIRLCQQLKAK